jgi:hypothetical protein
MLFLISTSLLDTLCIYLESEPPGADAARNFWVRYRIAVVHQRCPERTAWRESSICTRTWNNSVLQFMKASEMVEPDAGLVARDTAVFWCEVLECCPWFEFGDVEMGAARRPRLQTHPTRRSGRGLAQAQARRRVAMWTAQLRRRWRRRAGVRQLLRAAMARIMHTVAAAAAATRAPC